LLAKNIDTLEKVIKTAFQQKRKTLKNNFKGILVEKDFLNLNISSNLRAESISVSDFIKIENYFYKEKLSF
jgi:16S rRNA (adenine1518-N6/adenine1519-N6)-dimethyltransferase